MNGPKELWWGHCGRVEHGSLFAAEPSTCIGFVLVGAGTMQCGEPVTEKIHYEPMTGGRLTPDMLTVLQEHELEHEAHFDGRRAGIIRQIRRVCIAFDRRLARIVKTIDDVETRCMAVDGPVTPTHEEITDDELRTIYVLAGGEVG